MEKKEQILSIMKDLEDKAITKHQATELILVLFNVNNRYSISDDFIWDKVCELDNIIPKYWKPDKVKNEPATYTKKLRTWLVNTINDC